MKTGSPYLRRRSKMAVFEGSQAAARPAPKQPPHLVRPVAHLTSGVDGPRVKDLMHAHLQELQQLLHGLRDGLAFTTRGACLHGWLCGCLLCTSIVCAWCVVGWSSCKGLVSVRKKQASRFIACRLSLGAQPLHATTRSKQRCCRMGRMMRSCCA